MLQMYLVQKLLLHNTGPVIFSVEILHQDFNSRAEQDWKLTSLISGCMKNFKSHPRGPWLCF